MTRRFLLLLLLLSGLAAAQNRVYELRTYTAVDGKLEAVKARFRDHTIAIFKRHGMESIGYWVPQDPEKSKNTLIYILAHPSMEAARKNWAAFRAGPELPNRSGKVAKFRLWVPFLRLSCVPFRHVARLHGDADPSRTDPPLLAPFL